MIQCLTASVLGSPFRYDIERRKGEEGRETVKTCMMREEWRDRNRERVGGGRGGGQERERERERETDRQRERETEREWGEGGREGKGKGGEGERERESKPARDKERGRWSVTKCRRQHKLCQDITPSLPSSPLPRVFVCVCVCEYLFYSSVDMKPQSLSIKTNQSCDFTNRLISVISTLQFQDKLKRMLDKPNFNTSISR